uniref:Uncharacterized protein n=1 Tax=Cacopsylla melanoneura TaxID=428564 RepID=A0A8D9AC25_9HEMI
MVLIFLSCLVNLLLRARVFFGLRSKGLYFLCSFLIKFLMFSFCFWCMTMYTRRMAFLTTLILDNLDAAPPVTLATLKLANSVLSSSSCFRSSFLSLVLNSEHFTLTILAALLVPFLMKNFDSF